MMENNESKNFDPQWRKAEILSIQNAAALIAGYDPQVVDNCRNDADFEQKFPKISTIENALENAILTGTLKVNAEYIEDPSNFSIKLSVEKTTVQVDTLRDWAENRGLKTDFFSTRAIKKHIPDFLDKNHKNYAPKLAAAVNAWHAITEDPSLIEEKTVKQALINWLYENADQFGLIKKDGNPNKLGIDEIAKVSNWHPNGCIDLPRENRLRF
jgi:hypothetical protein